MDMKILKGFALTFGLVCMLTIPSFGQKAAAAKADPAKGVRDAFERLIDGIKQADVDKVMSVYEKSDRVQPAKPAWRRWTKSFRLHDLVMSTR